MASEVLQDGAAVATCLAFLGGIWIAVKYGCKANASIAGTAYMSNGRWYVVVRPSVQAVGVFRLRFPDDYGTWIQVTEVRDHNGKLSDGRSWSKDRIFNLDFVEAGETLTTSVLFPLGSEGSELVGWRLILVVRTMRWPAAAQVWEWSDTTFVPSTTGATS